MRNKQLRMQCSKLNHHLCSSLHVIDSPRCSCGGDCEDSKHFLLECPLYFESRREMLTQIRNICNLDISTHLLLFGSGDLDFDTNCKIFEVVHSFIESTNRL